MIPTSYGDIVPFIMSNAICINFMIIIQLADSYRVQLVGCVANGRPILLLNIMTQLHLSLL